MNPTQHYIGGVHALTQIILQGSLQKLFVADNKHSKKVAALVALADQENISIEFVPLYHLDLLLPGIKHQGVVGECWLSKQGPENWQQAIAGVERPFLLILDGLQDPHNLGACLRSALAAGVHAVLIPKAKAAEITPVVDKVSCGASEVLPIFSVANLRREIQAMQQQGIWVVGGAGEQSTIFYELDLTLPLALVLGNEGDGLHYGIRQQCDHLAAIPMDPRMESLNVSVACGVMLFEVLRQRRG